MDDLMRDVEMPLSLVLYSMEQYGIRAQKEELITYGEKLSGRITELEQSIIGHKAVFCAEKSRKNKTIEKVY